jgi:poly(3-hydroxybutyrate) depolymerase
MTFVLSMHSFRKIWIPVLLSTRHQSWGSFLLVLVLVMISCKKEDSQEKVLLQFVLIDQYNKATFIINNIDGYDGQPPTFKIYLDDSLALEMTGTNTLTLNGLTENSEYAGHIEAYSNGLLIGSCSFHFFTEVNRPPGKFEIISLKASATKIEIGWSQSKDPENESVMYKLFINNILSDSLVGLTTSLVEGLLPSQVYHAELIASDLSGKSCSCKFSFYTTGSEDCEIVYKLLEFQGLKREAIWFVPKVTPVHGFPLLIDLHGANGNAWNLMQGNYFNEIASREGFIHVMPQALQGTYNGETLYQWNAHFIFQWDDAAFLDFLVETMKAEYAIDTSRIYLTGMSNGGFMTFFAAAYSKTKWAAIAPMAGLISTNVFSNYSPGRSIPLCYIHGTDDPLVLYEGSPSAQDVIDFWVTNNQCAPMPEITQLPDIYSQDHSTVTLFIYPGFTGLSEVRLYRINGGGHSIPGIEPGANMDINAYEEIWSFFSRHRLP